MRMLRNREVRRTLFAQGVVLLGGTIASSVLVSTRAGLLVCGVGLLLCGISLFATWKRYQSLDRLSASIDRALHFDDAVLTEAEEGELSVLQSEIQKLTLRLREQNTMLAEEKSALADAIADISHQLKTPLTSMNLLISLLRVAEVPDEKRMALTRRMQQLSEQVDGLLDALLKLSKLDAGAIPLASTPVSVAEMLRAAAAPMEIPIELKGLHLVWDVPADASFVGDSAWSAEAFGNLIKNCVEHTEADGTLRLCAEENALYTEIVLSDNGSGFREEDLPHIFERFYQAAGATQGFGIGLALARKIIVAQNGTICAKNATGGGAEFQVRFYKTVI